jgi:hypothetical protein
VHGDIKPNNILIGLVPHGELISHGNGVREIEEVDAEEMEGVDECFNRDDFASVKRLHHVN